MDRHAVLRRPIITEKTDGLTEAVNQYVFEVDPRANKREVREAVQSLFDVSVVKVRTMVLRGKTRRWGRHVTRTPRWKKAVVTLAAGDRIDVME